MQAKPHVIEIVDKDEKIKTVKRLLEEFNLDFKVNPGDTYILVAKNQHGVGSIGLLIAERRGQSRLSIKWLHVKKIWRRLSIASTLIKHLESLGQKNGISIISAVFDQKNSGMNRLINSKNGWITGEGLNAYTFSKKVDLAPAITRGETAMRKRNLQASILRLSECNDQEVLLEAEAKDLPSWAQLDQLLLNQAERELSRIFYINNHIIGWLITFSLTTDTLDYQILWVDQEHRNTGIMVVALAEVMRAAHLQENPKKRQQSAELQPWRRGFFMVHSENQGMIRWVQKRLSQGEDGKTTLIYREKLIAKALMH